MIEKICVIFCGICIVAAFGVISLFITSIISEDIGGFKMFSRKKMYHIIYSNGLHKINTIVEARNPAKAIKKLEKKENPWPVSILSIEILSDAVVKQVKRGW